MGSLLHIIDLGNLEMLKVTKRVISIEVKSHSGCLLSLFNIMADEFAESGSDSSRVQQPRLPANIYKSLVTCLKADDKLNFPVLESGSPVTPKLTMLGPHLRQQLTLPHSPVRFGSFPSQTLGSPVVSLPAILFNPGQLNAKTDWYKSVSPPLLYSRW